MVDISNPSDISHDAKIYNSFDIRFSSPFNALIHSKEGFVK